MSSLLISGQLLQRESRWVISPFEDKHKVLRDTSEPQNEFVPDAKKGPRAGVGTWQFGGLKHTLG